MNFEQALSLMKIGRTFKRHNWNGKDLCVYMYIPQNIHMTNEQFEQNTVINPHFRIWDSKRKTIDVWVPSTSDIFSDDWVEIGKLEGYK